MKSPFICGQIIGTPLRACVYELYYQYTPDKVSILIFIYKPDSGIMLTCQFKWSSQLLIAAPMAVRRVY